MKWKKTAVNSLKSKFQQYKCKRRVKDLCYYMQQKKMTWVKWYLTRRECDLVQCTCFRNQHLEPFPILFLKHPIDKDSLEIELLRSAPGLIIWRTWTFQKTQENYNLSSCIQTTATLINKKLSWNIQPLSLPYFLCEGLKQAYECYILLTLFWIRNITLHTCINCYGITRQSFE